MPIVITQFDWVQWDCSRCALWRLDIRKAILQLLLVSTWGWATMAAAGQG